MPPERLLRRESSKLNCNWPPRPLGGWCSSSCFWATSTSVTNNGISPDRFWRSAEEAARPARPHCDLASFHCISEIGSCHAPSRNVRELSLTGHRPRPTPHDPSRARTCRDVRRPSCGFSRRFRDVPPPCCAHLWACQSSFADRNVDKRIDDRHRPRPLGRPGRPIRPANPGWRAPGSPSRLQASTLEPGRGPGV